MPGSVDRDRKAVFSGDRVSFGEMRKFWRWMVGWLHNGANELTPLNGTRKMGKMVTLYVMRILLQFLKIKKKY